jgi:anti-sigma regulatory factor (Ser/Thr protein kinase)
MSDRDVAGADIARPRNPDAMAFEGLPGGLPTGGEAPASWSASMDLPPAACVATVARALLSRLLTVWGEGRLIEDSTLVISELLANAVEHAGTSGSLRLELTLHDQMLRLAVADGSAARPVGRHAADGDEGGRGISIIEHLAVHWGVEDRDPGKRVWVELQC